MKKINSIILFAIVMLGTLTFSCHDDLSTLDVEKIPGVAFDTTGMSTLSVYQFEHLVVEPELSTSGLSETDLSYTWRINLKPNDTLFQVIGEGKNLDYEVRFKPNATGYHHLLFYTVRDNKTGLEYMMSWPVTVKNNIGEGLVIAETSDGITTDISHIMYAGVTTDYSGESVKHKVYSSINGSTIEGLIKQMRFTSIYGVDALLAITDNRVLRVNTLDYTLAGTNDDLFYGSTTDYQPQALGGIVQGDMYVENGRLTGTYLGASRKFGLPFDFAYSVPDHVAFNGYNNYPAVVVNFYDEENGHFVYLPSISAWGDRKMYAAPTASAEAPFNPASIPNKVNVAAKVYSNADFLHLLKDKTTGELGLYVLDGGGYEYPNTIPPAPKAFYDLSAAPEIQDATQFVLLDNQRVMYYATANKIYAVLYSTSTPVIEERYTVPAGEEITTLQVYQQADYPFRSTTDPAYLATNNKQLIMSTYNGSEGKVYVLPMVNAGVGNIDVSGIKTFTGFDRITAIATQK